MTLTATRPRAKGPTPLGVKAFTFPDGQPHVSLEVGSRVALTARIANPTDLFEVLLAAEAARAAGATFLELDIVYLMAARMDRRMPVVDGHHQPFTLQVVADVLETAKFDRVTILDPHSDVAPALLGATPVSPLPLVKAAVGASFYANTVLVSPDAGASKKTQDYAMALGGLPVVQCLKHRDPATGALSGFQLVNPDPKLFNGGRRFLIVDDLCDGGGTFIAIAKLLRDHGADLVDLCITHGIFSKGCPITGISSVFTTNSYREFPASDDLFVYRVI